MKRKPNVQDFTGSVNIDGDVTPITRQPVERLNAKNWSSMTTAELLNQRDILQVRYYKALSVGISTDAIKEGLKMIDALIELQDENGSGSNNSDFGFV